MERGLDGYLGDHTHTHICRGQGHSEIVVAQVQKQRASTTLGKVRRLSCRFSPWGLLALSLSTTAERVTGATGGRQRVKGGGRRKVVLALPLAYADSQTRRMGLVHVLFPDRSCQSGRARLTSKTRAATEQRTTPS